MHRGGYSRAARSERRRLARDPRYFGGKCMQCTKRPRDYNHPKYPSQCSVCRQAMVKHLMSVDPTYYKYLLDSGVSYSEITKGLMNDDNDNDRRLRLSLVESKLPLSDKKGIIQNWLSSNEIGEEEAAILLKTAKESETNVLATG